MEFAEVLNLRQRRATSPFSIDDVPASVGDAYAIAAQIAQAQGGDVVAWKLGATTPATRAAFDTDVVYYGAILATEMFIGPATIKVDMAPFRGEAEIAVRLGQDLTAEEALALDIGAKVFDAFAPAIECPWSVVSNLPEAGLTALLMDRCAAGLLLLGQPRDLDEGAMDELLEILVDGVPIASGRSSVGLVMSPIEAACFAIREIGAHRLYLKKGQWISTGGITACVLLPNDRPFSLHYSKALEFVVFPEVAA